MVNCLMVQITDLKPNKAKKRVSVFIDEVFSFSLDKEIVVQAGLHKGQDIHSDKRSYPRPV